MTNKEIIIMCDCIINNINQAESKGQCSFLCDEIVEYINISRNGYIDYISREKIIYYIPEFTIENAIKYADARIPINNDLGWWDGYTVNSVFNYKDRIKFIQWIKKQYVTPEEKPLI